MPADEPETSDLEPSDRRFELLSEANSLLLSSYDAESVIQVIGDKVLRHLGADVFFNYVLDPGATRLRLNAWGGVPARIARMIEHLEPGQAICGCVARDGERIISEDVQHNGDPRADLVRRMGVRCYCCHPLTANGTTVGTLSFGTKRKDTFDDDEIELMHTVAGQVSVALDRSRTRADLSRAVQQQAALAHDLHASLEEQSALSLEMGRRAERETLLRELAEIGVSSTTELEAADRTLAHVVKRLGCAAGALFAPGEAGTTLMPLAAAGITTADLNELFGPLAVDGPAPSVTALRETGPACVLDLEADPRVSAPARTLARRLGVHASFSAPLGARDTHLGTIWLAWPDAGDLGSWRLSLLESVAAEVAIGLSNARLYEAERDRWRLGQSMVEVQSALLSSLDVDQALPRVLDEMIAQLRGIGATISQRTGDGWLIRAVEGSTARVLRPGRLFRDEEAPALMQVLTTRSPVVVEDLAVAGRFNQRVNRRAGVAAFATYPLMLRGEVTGAVTIQLGAPHSFSESELEYVRRAAFAISLSEENARLYKAERALSDRLQSALLALPGEVDGIEFSHAYHAATETERVGGDFYDVFDLDDDRVGIVMGDVAGHGIDAAVLTSMVKYTIRAHATEAGKTPGQILSLTNDLVYRATSTEVFVTVFLAQLDRHSGRMVYGNAGHPAGVIVSTGGETTRLPAAGPILGAFPDVSYEQAEAQLDIGDLLFLYTDGLTEARTDAELFGEKRVLGLLANAHGNSPVQVVAKAVEAAVDFADYRLRDDLAILALRRATGTER